MSSSTTARTARRRTLRMARRGTHPSPEGKGIVVFLSPRHPAHALAAIPL
ncbi:hypothetical protein ACGF4C_26855 [Streptomyces sp. NPDC048197]